MEGLLGHKSDFQLFMQDSNMTECVVIFYCAVYHHASGVNASCICSESLLLCVPSDSASCSIIIYSDSRLEVFCSFCGVFESVQGECAGQRSKRNNKEICDAPLQKVSSVTIWSVRWFA